MNDFTTWDILRNLLLAARWTIVLSVVAFIGGGVLGLFLLMARQSGSKAALRAVQAHVALFQSTPLLMQLFLVYFGLPVLGLDVAAWFAAALCLTLYASAYLCDIWRGAVEAIPKGQWDASAAVGLHYLRQLRLVILPQAVPAAIPPTVGFLVQLVKSTALASILGYRELTKTAQILTNATFQPFLIFALVALIYFALCYPLTAWSRALERKVARSR
ncbi:MAG: amino acid ABC transporter permease [Aestuariivirga sp.]